MALVGGVRVSGLNEVVRSLQAIGLELTDLKDAFGKISAEAAHKASSFAPKKTGRLAGNIRGSKTKNRAIVTAGGARVPYAAAINYGWGAHHITPARFMQRADDAMRDKALDMLDDAINAAIKKKGLK